MTLFEHLDNICVKRYPDFNDPEIEKTYDCFMVNRYVSMSLEYVGGVLPLSVYNNIPKETHFQYLCNALPKKKQFFQYIKKPKDKNLTKEDYEILYGHFKCGSKDFQIVMDSMTEDEVKSLLSKYKRYGKNK